MRYAIVLDGLVTNVVEAPEGWVSPVGLAIVSETAGIGWSHVDGEWRAPPVGDAHLSDGDRLAAATAAVEAHVQAVARARKYTSAESCASYVASTIAIWAAEARAFIAWRDAVWSSAYATLAAVQAGTEPAPTIDVLIAGLPPIDWPVG